MDVISYNRFWAQEYDRTESIDALRRYVISETLSPIEDYQNAVSIICRTYGKPHTDITLLFIGAYLSSQWTSSTFCLDILNDRFDHLPADEKAIVCFLNAHHIRWKDTQYRSNPAYETYLLESLHTAMPFAANRLYLSELYTGAASSSLRKEALDNIAEVYSAAQLSRMTLDDFADPAAFVREHILMTHISDVNYEIICEF